MDLEPPPYCGCLSLVHASNVAAMGFPTSHLLKPFPRLPLSGGPGGSISSPISRMTLTISVTSPPQLVSADTSERKPHFSLHDSASSWRPLIFHCLRGWVMCLVSSILHGLVVGINTSICLASHGRNLLSKLPTNSFAFLHFGLAAIF